MRQHSGLELSVGIYRLRCSERGSNMKKTVFEKYKYVAVILAIILLPLVGCTASHNGQSAALEGEKKAAGQQQSDNDLSSNALNNTYKIDGYNQDVTLVNGKSTPIANSRLTAVLSIGSQPAVGNLTIGNKTVRGAALLLAVNGGGNGVFSYVAASFTNDEGKSIGTNAINIGDRLRPQNIRIENGNIIVDYLDRNPGEAMASTPTVGKSKTFTIRENMLAEVNNKAYFPVAGKYASDETIDTPDGKEKIAFVRLDIANMNDYHGNFSMPIKGAWLGTWSAPLIITPNNDGRYPIEIKHRESNSTIATEWEVTSATTFTMYFTFGTRNQVVHMKKVD